METAKREMTFLLGEPERRLLRWIAARLPATWMPDHLTAFGMLGALMVGAGYALSVRHPGWLWLANAGLFVNWFGDSLDGTLARVRKTERPKYGYYVDHMVDAINTTMIGVGIGLSPFVDLPLAMLLVILFLSLSINVYLESSVFGLFEISYGIFGPTEVRILLFLANVGLFTGAVWKGVAPEAVEEIANWVFILLSAGMFISLAARFSKNLQRLARVEPQKRA